jgi:hypothetical protein
VKGSNFYNPGKPCLVKGRAVKNWQGTNMRRQETKNKEEEMVFHSR